MTGPDLNRQKVIPIEVRLQKKHQPFDSALEEKLCSWIWSNHNDLILDSPIILPDEFKKYGILGISTGEIEGAHADSANHSLIVSLNSGKFLLKFYPYFCFNSGPFHETASDNNNRNDDDDDDGADGMVQYSHWDLPNQVFDGLWENLLLPVGTRSQLLNYINTAILFSKRGVNSNIVSVNRLILLHGDPGTGKTTLCKALAQKSAIRLMPSSFKNVKFIEINSHSLFSKWFSESGKLVAGLFEDIVQLAMDYESLIFVLIDEVESLTAARSCALAGSEPSDSIRVVNALLTQIDRLKCFPNVLIMATSNITEAVDPAFLDRSDMIIKIPCPDRDAIFKILVSAIKELIRSGLIKDEGEHLMDPATLRNLLKVPGSLDPEDKLVLLYELCKRAEGKISGRFLRKLPFITFSDHFISSNGNEDNQVKMQSFLMALSSEIKLKLQQ